jgi:hypothetical protein
MLFASTLLLPSLYSGTVHFIVYFVFFFKTVVMFGETANFASMGFVASAAVP